MNNFFSGRQAINTGSLFGFVQGHSRSTGTERLCRSDGWSLRTILPRKSTGLRAIRLEQPGERRVRERYVALYMDRTNHDS